MVGWRGVWRCSMKLTVAGRDLWTKDESPARGRQDVGDWSQPPCDRGAELSFPHQPDERRSLGVSFPHQPDQRRSLGDFRDTPRHWADALASLAAELPPVRGGCLPSVLRRYCLPWCKHPGTFPLQDRQKRGEKRVKY